MYEPTFEGYSDTQEAPEVFYSPVEIFQAHARAVDIYSHAHSVPSHPAPSRGLDGMTSAAIPARDYDWRSKKISELLEEIDEFLLHPVPAAVLAGHLR